MFVWTSELARDICSALPCTSPYASQSHKTEGRRDTLLDLGVPGPAREIDAPSISKEVKQAQARPAADQAWSGDVYASGCRTPVRTHAKAHTPGKGVRRQARKHPFLCRSTRPEAQPSTRSIAEHFSRHVRGRRRAQRCPEMSTCVQRCPGMRRAHSKDSRVSS